MSEEIMEKETPQTKVEPATPETPTEKTGDKSIDTQSLQAQKEHQREKREIAEARVKELEAKLANVPTATQAVDPLEVVKLGKAVADYDEEETSFIIRNAKDKSPQGIIDASKDSWVQTAINARREKVAKEKQILGPSSPGATPTFSPKSPQEIAKMPKEEYDEYLENLKNSVPSTNQGL
jgi:transcription elongation GreA/GreB family factor